MKSSVPLVRILRCGKGRSADGDGLGARASDGEPASAVARFHSKASSRGLARHDKFTSLFSPSARSRCVSAASNTGLSGEKWKYLEASANWLTNGKIAENKALAGSALAVRHRLDSTRLEDFGTSFLVRHVSDARKREGRQKELTENCQRKVIPRQRAFN